MNPHYPAASADNLSFSAGYEDFAGLSADFQASLIQEERRCRYPSKRCEFPRAIKRNGEMHRFCAAHRDKANLNQRRLEARRKKEMQDLETSSHKSYSPSPEHEMPPSLDRKSWSGPYESSPPLHSVLAQDELNFLSELLTQNSLEDLHAGNQRNLTEGSVPFDSRFVC